jgi:hypothetical protein
MKKEIQHFNLGLKIQELFGEIYSKNTNDTIAEIKSVAVEFAGFSKDVHTLWINLSKRGQTVK